MPRAWFAGSLALVLCWAGLAYAQDPPALEAPADESKASTPAKPPSKPKTPAPKPPATTSATAPPNARANPPASPGSQVRPLLVIPGVTTPGSRPPVTSRPFVPQTSRPAGAAVSPPTRTGPPLAAPSQGRSPFRQGEAQPSSRSPSDALGQSIPLTIEPLEDEPQPERDGRPGRSSSPPPDSPARPRPRGSSAASRPGAKDSSEDSPAASARSRPAPRPFPGILGRLFPPPPGSVRGESGNSSASARRKENEKALDRSEPQSDAAIKRKIEKQIRDTLGDRVRSVEVRVRGKNVLVVARATRFWQRRLVRRSLETLPALDGYRARIELDD
jgi:hypothetical protein